MPYGMLFGINYGMFKMAQFHINGGLHKIFIGIVLALFWINLEITTQ
jgi:hypothetical protein